MKKLIIIIAICTGLAVPGLSATHLFMLSGQSNMSNLVSDAAFTPTVTAELAGDTVVVINTAVPGAGINGWVVDDRPYYTDMLAAVAETGCTPDTITFCWMQGESDANAALCDTYEGKLRRLIRNLRTDLDFPGMGAVIGRINGERGEYWEVVREAQVAVAESDPAGTWIDTDDIPLGPDFVHFSIAGYEQLGGRLAVAALGLLGHTGAKIVVVEGLQTAQPVKADNSGCFLSTLQ